eukprot:8601097-Pyramimonas_sp.AAC.1
MGNSPQPGEPPSIGAWPAGDTVLLWDQLPTHRESWPLIVVFDGQVLTRFSCLVCQDGTLVSREVPRFSDVDKAVTLVKVSDWYDHKERNCLGQLSSTKSGHHTRSYAPIASGGRSICSVCPLGGRWSVPLR